MDVLSFLQLFFAGGTGGLLTALALYIRARGQNKNEARAQQDDYSIKLRAALDADEGTLRASLMAMVKDFEVTARDLRQALAAEEKARRELDQRLTETQKQLTVVTLERDELKRQQERDQKKIEGSEYQIRQLQADLSAAHEKIRHMETEIAQLRTQQGG